MTTINLSIILGDEPKGIPGGPTPDDKATKAEANYRKMSTEEACGNCSMFGRGRCDIVVGSIDPDYVCDYWEARD